MMASGVGDRLVPTCLALLGKPILLAVLSVALLGCAAAFWFSRPHRTAITSTQPQIESLAVLPLMNLSGDAQQEYLVDGMKEILITDLAKMGSLKRVIARNSGMQTKHSHSRLQAIAGRRHADALGTG